MKELKMVLAAMALGSLSLVAGCGTLLGAGVGAAAGCAIDDDDCERGAAVGGAAGAVAGTVLDPP